MKLWKPKKETAHRPTTPGALNNWARAWGRRLAGEITLTDRYFGEVLSLLGDLQDPQRAELERAMNWSAAAWFEYEAGRWDAGRRDLQLTEAASLLQNIGQGGV